MPFVRSLMRATAFVTALRHDVGGAELAGEFLPRFVTAHRDNPLGPHLPGREHAKKADGAVADNNDGRPRLHVSGIGGEPASTQDVRSRQQARHEVVGRRASWRRHERSVRLRHTQERRLRPQHELTMNARRLVAIPAMGTGVVRRGERADHELPRLDGLDRAADLFDERRSTRAPSASDR